MTAHLFYVSKNEDLSLGSIINVCDKELIHAKVRRISINEQILISNGIGDKCEARVIEFTSSKMKCVIDNIIKEKKIHPFIIVQALTKNNQHEKAIELCSEIGAHTFVPWISELSVVKADNDKEKKIIKKWQNIAYSTAKLSRRSYIPKIMPLQRKNLALLLKKYKNIFVLDENANNTFHAFNFCKSDPVVIIIGPEGGISKKDLISFQENSSIVKTVKISENILRSSTAAAVAMSQIIHQSI